MARWEPDARGRLQQAAMSLFRERGYAEVTVAEIADRAGLSKRSFFNHFADKREVFFANAQFFEESVLAHLASADPRLSAIDATVLALTRCGLDLSTVTSAEDAQTRLDVLVATPELRERDLNKTAELTAAMVEALGRRGVPPRTAGFAAQAGLAVFTVAVAEWLATPAADFPDLMRRALNELREAVA
ncbi:TetR/AcrR family transcriptional regulator [Actinoplanes sp. M2I2]|uniref:TetR/AcrR family transcriptional regulator n=1 Tax=Actinoplanes sp. M2I2 TaxID=1734444 RepID=UPI0020203F66|nr:TetR/AcrR family transcriptional regulator [Actinoplanes sp. M2I2]